MKKSLFNINIKNDKKILLYNTFSTSLVSLEENLYNKIFDKNDFSLPETETLYNMGFLVDDDCDEVKEMERIRTAVINNSSSQIANIIIAPTLECNAHCYYCFENGYRKGKMDYETADSLVTFLTNNWNHKKLGITWFGGEPLLSSDIIDYISQKLLDNGVIFGSKITTNGSLLNEELIEHAIHLWNVEKIQITIDALEDEYNKIKHYDKEYVDPFSLVMENINLAINNNIRIKIRINFNPNEQKKALDTMNFLLSKFSNSELIKIYFAPIDADDEIVRNITNEFPDFEEHPYISLIKFGRQHHLYRGFPDMEDDDSKYGKFDSKGLLKKLKIYPSTINCYATCPNVFSIAPNGDIYKCHRVLGREEYASGNVKSGIANNDAYKFFCNTKLTYDECNSCSILPICQGGCKVNARLYSGKEACAPCKAIIEDLILLYKEDLSNM